MSSPAGSLTELSLASQRFPGYLKEECTQLKSLTLEAITFTPGEFTPLLKSRRLLRGLENITSLTLINMPDFPRIILASCVRLVKLTIEDVKFVDDASAKLSVPRPQPVLLTCRDTDEHTFVQLVSIIDVTELAALTCDLALVGAEGRDTRPKGPQHILDLCRSSLELLYLVSSTCSANIRLSYTFY